MVEDEDFQALIAGLETTGMTRSQIAAATGRCRTTIWRLAEGVSKEPGYNTAMRLKNLATDRAAVSHMQRKVAY